MRGSTLSRAISLGWFLIAMWTRIQREQTIETIMCLLVAIYFAIWTKED